MGAAIKHFNSIGIDVPRYVLDPTEELILRSRFLPVKQSSDLLLIKSKLYNLQHGVLTMDPSREFGGTPVIKLGEWFLPLCVGAANRPGPKFKKVQVRLTAY